jgi:hypothetical protein
MLGIDFINKNNVFIEGSVVKVFLMCLFKKRIIFVNAHEMVNMDGMTIYLIRGHDFKRKAH